MEDMALQLLTGIHIAMLERTVFDLLFLSVYFTSQSIDRKDLGGMLEKLVTRSQVSRLPSLAPPLTVLPST